jgi:hypothetical protein
MPFHGFGLPAAAGWFTTIIPVLVQFVLFLRWLHRRMRNEEMTRAFLRDMALIHLPHIYSVLREVAARQGITLEENPVVRFLDLNGHRRS